MRWLFRRIFWIGTGVSMGFGGAMWIRARVLRAVERVLPQRVQKDLAQGVKKAGGTVAGAITEGRAAMRQREAELRRQFPAGRP
ncbi:MAG TPA: hypothetical protein VIL36_04670 [Acidimicrobiales bacterium]